MANPENEKVKNDAQVPEASGGYQTPIDEEARHTGMDVQSKGKPSAVPESGDSDQITEGAGNQGTEKR
ncbi:MULTISPECIES: hypothetical protein [Nostocales]|uniref:Uncharacterized protein n=3 Tax=Nostocales TaxID=1161 RepID=A0A0C1R525_9CYAN|nr:hypothetical protein [Tolypothrix bouteillei]KAF3886931.1 hypothetical protein DA73_0400016620 [Tolypothrix bouteillei VB521301]